MKGENTINLNGKQYAIAFNYGSFRLLGTFWKMNTIADVVEKISNVLSNIGEKGLTFDQEDVVVYLIYSGIKDDELEIDDIINSGILLDAVQLEKVFNAFSESFTKLGKQTAPEPKKKVKKK
jgi:hypothetical protein